MNRKLPGTTITFTQPPPDPNVCGVVYYATVPMSRCPNAKPCADHPQTQRPDDDRALCLARRFHDIYEELAPQFGYETRGAETRVFDAESANGRLMIAVCRVILHEVVDVPAAHEAAKKQKSGGSGYVVYIVKPEARDPHRADVPCPLWMHRFVFQMTSTVRQPLLLCEACGWTYAEVIEDVEKGGQCAIGDCRNDRAAGTAVCTMHGAVNTFAAKDQTR